ncbi:MAG: carbon monoxide dehydrogenase [Candidatus Viridilinea halotolerans]|uniref:Carbon monoxide dehydrogenase n=1 Tax=Candidatus Viridilinea halotolerans TaxID=2491704 RepID=A0A426UCJ9_9CHLR|nr:MAG: carbon monoxide dehydrogenase [Candidatus Viridilinea halotolerans]
MRIAGNYTFAASREEVWAAINDPEVIARILPGCQRLDVIGDYEYESALHVDLHVVRGHYTGRVRLDKLVSPESFELVVGGEGNNSTLQASGSLQLRSEGEQTILDYGGEARFGGILAALSQQQLDGAVRTLLHQSLKALAQQIAARQRAGAHAAQTLAPDEPLAPVVADRRTHTVLVPPSQQLTELRLVRGMLEDALSQKSWLLWVMVAFLLGYLLGRRRGRGA